MNSTASKGRPPGWHWSEYWRSGRSEIVNVDTAQGVVAFDPGAAWREFFEGFPDGARLLDLATGGGHVARLAAESAAARGKVFDVVGVDYAELGPEPSGLGGSVRLLGGVALEKLPFETASFDGATSQFGIEYADTRRALPELARVLRPNARARLLVHNADSAISRSTAAQSAAHDRVLPDNALIQLGRRAYAAHLHRRSPEAIAGAERAFREGVRRAAARLTPDPHFDQARYHVEYLADLAERISRYAPASALQRLEVFEAGVDAWRQRHRSQIRAALDQRGLQSFVGAAAKCGLTTLDTAQETDARGALIAWRVDMRRD